MVEQTSILTQLKSNLGVTTKTNVFSIVKVTSSDKPGEPKFQIQTNLREVFSTRDARDVVVLVAFGNRDQK